jgi:integrase
MIALSDKLGIPVTCHALRRTFATIADKQGRSINSIRIALGHTNLRTTQVYLRTSEAEVVEQMKDW